MRLLTDVRYWLSLTLLVYGVLGVSQIGNFVTADEHYWVYERVPQYYEAWHDLKLRKTFINDKPGVSLALVSGPALLWNEDTEKHCGETAERFIVCNQTRTAFLFGSFRTLVLVMNGCFLVLIFFLLRRLSNPWVALWSTMLMALSPILLGLSQIVNPDALLWSAGSAALLAWLALMKTGEQRYAFLALGLLAFALLTKYVALILIPGFVLASGLYFLLRRDGKSDGELILALKREVLWLVVAVGGAITIVIALVPALIIERKYLAEFLMTIPDKERLVFWFSPLALWFFVDLYLLRGRSLLTLRSLIQRFFSLARLIPVILLTLFVGLIIIRHAFPDWDIFSVLPFDLKDLSDARYYTTAPNAFEVFLLEWNPLVFTFTPLALCGLALAWIQGVRKTEHDYFFFPLFIGVFSLLFMAILVRSNVLATPRYAILLYPLLTFTAAIGWWHIARRFETHSWVKPFITSVLLFGSLVPLVLIRPFYFNYANALLPRTALVSDAWGYGGYQAAHYLNRIPGRENLVVWADYYGVCEFARFKCLTAYTFDRNVVQPDYYVLTRRGRLRYWSRYERWERLSGLKAYQYYDRSDPVWLLEIDNRPGNYVKVFKVEK
jgi:hypothetical protein